MHTWYFVSISLYKYLYLQFIGKIMKDSLPTYEVEELSLEQAVLLLATEEEKQQTIYTETSTRLLEELCAA